MAKIEIPRGTILRGIALKNSNISSDTAVSLSTTTVSKSDSTASMVRSYADGTRRIVEGPQRNIQATINTTVMKRSVYLKIKPWIGEQVLYKDATNEYIWGLLKSVTVQENSMCLPDEIYSMSIVIDQITSLQPGIPRVE